jgi:hypothetical protein
MNKVIANVCVIGWSCFAVFGYLALTAPDGNDAQMLVATVLAAAGLFTGVFSYLKLARQVEPQRWRHVPQRDTEAA